MRTFWQILSSLGTLSLAFFFGVMASLGKRMGEALHTRGYYRLYWAAAALSALPIPVGWLVYLAGWAGFPDVSETAVYRIEALVFLLPLCIGASMALYATLRYWKWVWPELRDLATRTERP